MSKRIILSAFLAFSNWACEPVDEAEGSGGIPASMGGAVSMMSQCTVCQDDAPFFSNCEMAEFTSDSERVCIDTDEDILCTTPNACCNEAGLDYDDQNQQCQMNDPGTSPMMSGEGQSCSTDMDCPDAFPRCDKNANNEGLCAPECQSNDDCADKMDRPFCNGTNRCAAASDGTCQIETPEDPGSADGECVGELTRCMPLSQGGTLGICVECYGSFECLASSSKPQCSTRGICIEANADNTCTSDSDCCPTPGVSCADQRRCNPDSKKCETVTP